MPIPFILAGAAVVAGATGVAKGAKAISNNSEAKEIISRAQALYNDAKDKVENQRLYTTDRLENLGKIKLDAWSNEMNTFVNIFNSFKNVHLEGKVEVNEKLKVQMQNPNNIRNMEIASAKASEVTKAGVASLGAGALAGIASYGGAMMFASASTGTAIASLSGAAATNATLAWFGGGALSAGGLGMAGGTLVLGGIVAGPVLAVAGFIMAAKSEENLAKARKTYAEAENAVEKMNIMTDFMKRISEIADDYSEFIIEYQNNFKPILRELLSIKDRGYRRQARAKKGLLRNKVEGNSKIDFMLLSQKEQKTLHLSWIMAQVFYNVLAAPLLTQSGDMDSKANNVLSEAKRALPQIEQERYEIEKMPNEEPIINALPQNKVDYQKKAQVQSRTYNQGSSNVVKGNGIGWRLLNGAMAIVNWLLAVIYIIDGLYFLSEKIIVGISCLIVGIIVCPLFLRKRDAPYKKKFCSKILRLAISFVVLVIIV